MAATLGSKLDAEPPPAGGRLVADTVPVAALTPGDVGRMFAIFERYYERASHGRFERDLGEKDRAILLRQGAGGPIRGFSTLRELCLEVDGRTVRGVYTGDTIIERGFWGQSALTRAFYLHLVRSKLRRPRQPYYWFLISKGFKTYLLLTNNFHVHYPRWERPTPPREQRIIDAFASALFGDGYDPVTGLIDLGEEHDRLRGGVAPIDPELMRSHPRIRFFAERNPSWERGTELACLAEMTWHVFAFYPLRTLAKALRRRRRRR